MTHRYVRSIAVLAFLALTAATAITNAQSVSVPINRDQLLTDLRTLSSEDMAGRLVGSEGSERARAYIVKRFTDIGVTPLGPSFESPFTFTGGRGANATERHGINLVGRIVGTTDPDQYLVVTAHYDHIGVRNGTLFPGADDNASGTAALFALAEYFQAHRPARSILFVAFDAEESGLRGARAFVAAPPVPKDAMLINLNMDMIGRDPNNLLYVVGTYAQPNLKPVIAGIAAQAPVTLRMGHDDPTDKAVENWNGSSDHAAFCQAGIPCLYFGVEDFDNHHKATDTYATMTHDFYVRAVQTMILSVQAFDRWNP